MKSRTNNQPVAIWAEEKFWTPQLCMAVSITVGLLAMLVPPEAWAQASSGLGKVQSRFSEVSTIIKGIAGVLIAIGVIWLGVKMLKGDQDTKDRALWVIAGGVVIGASGQIAEWIQGT